MHWILSSITYGFHLGLGLPIQGANPLEGYTGTCRASVENNGPP